MPVPSSTSSLGQSSVLLAADPAIPEHYTVAALNAAGTQFLIEQTYDSGSTWSGATTVAEDATKIHFLAWMSYSPEGVLGLMWRTRQPGPGPFFPYSVWAAISMDGGATFSPPLKISTGDSPAAPSGGIYGTRLNAGDDYSGMTLDRHDAFISWADWGPGERSVFFSAIKHQAFTYPGRGR